MGKLPPQKDPNFGNGEVGGDKSWDQPVHATDGNGNPITISFGRGNNTGQNLVQSGHVDGTSFYGDKEKGIKPGHDHYDKQGNTRKGGDRGGYN